MIPTILAFLGCTTLALMVHGYDAPTPDFRRKFLARMKNIKTNYQRKVYRTRPKFRLHNRWQTLNGKGGGWANQVYRIHPIYKDLGCWVDTMNRAIPPIDHMLGGYYRNRKDAIHKCGKLAAKMGFSVFAVQHGGYCVSSKNAESTYNMYGPSTQCHKNGKGGPWANQVYKIKSRCDQNFKIVNLGCWKDTRHRAIASKDHLLGGNYQKRKHAWDKCRKLAMKLGNTVFALQHSGWCATSKNAEQTYMKYGPAKNCGGDGEGGAWANQVYKINCD